MKPRELTICIKFRAFNAKNILDIFPLPWIADLFDSLGKVRHFSSIDLKNAYYLARIAAGDTHKTALLTN